MEGDEKSIKKGGSAPEIRSPRAGYKARLPLPGRALPVTAEEGSRHGRRGRSAAGARGWGEPPANGFVGKVTGKATPAGNKYRLYCTCCAKHRCQPPASALPAPHGEASGEPPGCGQGRARGNARSQAACAQSRANTNTPSYQKPSARWKCLQQVPRSSPSAVPSITQPCEHDASRSWGTAEAPAAMAQRAGHCLVND